MINKFIGILLLSLTSSTLSFAQKDTIQYSFSLNKTAYFITVGKNNPKYQNDTVFYKLYRKGKPQAIGKEIRNIINKKTGDTLKSGYYHISDNSISFYRIGQEKKIMERLYQQDDKGLLSLKTNYLDFIPPVAPPVAINSEKVNQKKILGEYDEPAEFPGGLSKARQFIGNNLQYPKKAYQNEIEGTIHAKFTVEINGSISNIEIINKLGYGLDEEVIRVLKRMPNWTPAKLKGNSVRSYFTMPISFKLN